VTCARRAFPRRALAVVAVALAPLAVEAGPDSSPAASFLAVRVSDARGAPVAGARVEAHDISGLLRRLADRGSLDDPRPISPIAREETDAAGRARLNVARGRYLVVATRAGQGLVARSGVPADAADVPEIVLRSEPERTCEGSVVDAAGAPVAGADVALGSPMGFGAGWEDVHQRVHATTDEQGRFRLAGIPVFLVEGPRIVVRTADGRLHRRDFESLPRALARPIRVGGRAVIVGSVRSRTGVPADGAWVLVEGRTLATGSLEPGGPWAKGWSAGATTGTDGRFRLDGLGEGDIRSVVAVSRHGVGMLGEPGHLGATETFTADVPLTMQSVFSGRLLRPSKDPLPQAEVFLVAPGSATWLARTDADGRWTTGPALPAIPMSLLVLPSSAGLVPLRESQRSPSSPSSSSTDDLVLEAPATVSGRVVDAAGVPVPDVKVLATWPHHVESTWSGADGSFLFPDLSPGPLTLAPETPTPGSSSWSGHVAPGSRTRDVVLRASSR
jgi:protocatechuate 3,4-dioxygenase beta subunit